MQLAAILDQYHDAFQAKYGSRLLPGHLRAINAINRCRTPDAGQLLVQCSHCGHTILQPRSCGHRSCPQCQNHETSLWLDRQHKKLLPVEYFMATFTLPYELRFLAWNHQALVYKLLFACASSTLKDFGLNPRNLARNLKKDERVCIMAVDFGAWYTLKGLFRGRFDRWPGIRLYGTVGPNRRALPEELNRWLVRVKRFKKFKGYDLLWKDIRTVRDIYFTDFQPVHLGPMTRHLQQDQKNLPSHEASQ